MGPRCPRSPSATAVNAPMVPQLISPRKSSQPVQLVSGSAGPKNQLGEGACRWLHRCSTRERVGDNRRRRIQIQKCNERLHPDHHFGRESEARRAALLRGRELQRGREHLLHERRADAARVGRHRRNWN